MCSLCFWRTLLLLFTAAQPLPDCSIHCDHVEELGMSWTDIDSQNGGQEYVEFLQAANGLNRIADYKRRTFELLQVAPGMSVLDVGCGTGIDAAALSDLVGPAGKVVAIDNSRTMLEQSRRNCRDKTNLQLLRADAYHLPFDTNSFDRVRADRVLQHLRDPEAIIQELARVTRPDGLICITEPDWRTVVIESDANRVHRAVLDAILARIQNPSMGARLKRLSLAAGLRNVFVEGRALIFESFAEANSILRIDEVCNQITGSRRIGKTVARRWLEELHRRDGEGDFFASITGFCVVGRKEQTA